MSRTNPAAVLSFKPLNRGSKGEAVPGREEKKCRRHPPAALMRLFPEADHLSGDISGPEAAHIQTGLPEGPLTFSYDLFRAFFRPYQKPSPDPSHDLDNSFAAGLSPLQQVPDPFPSFFWGNAFLIQKTAGKAGDCFSQKEKKELSLLPVSSAPLNIGKGLCQIRLIEV